MGPQGVETAAAVAEDYMISQPQISKSQLFPHYPQDFGHRIISIIKDSLMSHKDPAAFSVLVLSFIFASSILSEDDFDDQLLEVINLECSNAYATVCLGLKSPKNDIFLNTFDLFSSHARSLVELFSSPDMPDVQAKKFELFGPCLFKCAVFFSKSLMSQMKKDSIARELAAVMKFIFSLCTDRDVPDDVKIAKLRPAMKILRTYFATLANAPKSQEIEMSCDCLLAALTSFVQENSGCESRSNDFKFKLLSLANQWLTLARNCTLDFFKADEDFQPKVFESTHPYADNRMPTPSLSTSYYQIQELTRAHCPTFS